MDCFWFNCLILPWSVITSEFSACKWTTMAHEKYGLWSPTFRVRDRYALKPFETWDKINTTMQFPWGLHDPSARDHAPETLLLEPSDLSSLFFADLSSFVLRGIRNVLSSIITWVRVWKKVSFRRPVKIWLLGCRQNNAVERNFFMSPSSWVWLGHRAR